MLREVRLYGQLGRLFGRVHHLAVSTAQEAVRALCANYPAFERYLREHSEPGYHVFLGKRNIGEEGLTDPTGCDEVIKIVPAIAGAKKGGFLQVILGAVLVVVGLVVPGAQWLVSVGAALALGGVAQMLTPMPKADAGQEGENKQSYIFSGAANTTAQGNPVPICYGEMVVGSAVISAGLYTEELPA